MRPYFLERFGNAASRDHAYGWEAAEAVARAREQVARAVGASPEEVVFTSGATEANNLALKGVVEAAGKPVHIVTTALEHKSVLDVCQALERRGVRVTLVPPDARGIVSPEAVAAAITEDTAVVSVMHANNEVGTIQPIAAIAAHCAARGVPLHVDAAQSAGKIPLDVAEMGIGLCSLSAHKVYGPKGIGALVVRRTEPRIRLAAQIHGGGHERGLRSGTLPVRLPRASWRWTAP